jgi:hypothetical protein
MVRQWTVLINALRDHLRAGLILLAHLRASGSYDWLSAQALVD